MLLSNLVSPRIQVCETNEPTGCLGLTTVLLKETSVPVRSFEIRANCGTNQPHLAWLVYQFMPEIEALSHSSDARTPIG